MARGAPDFGRPVYTFGGSNVDNNEIQQMLLGFGLIDALGRTVLYDDFSQGLVKWLLADSGANDKPILANAQSDNQGIGFRAPFVTVFPNNGAPANWGAMISYNYSGTQSRLGLEIGFITYNNAPRFEFILTFRLAGAGVTYQCHVDFDVPNNRILLYSNSGNVTLDTWNGGTAGSYRKVQFKVVGDWSTQKYSRFLVGEKKYDVSSYLLETGAIVGDGESLITIRSYDKAPSFRNYIGYVRQTKDEP